MRRLVIALVMLSVMAPTIVAPPPVGGSSKTGVGPRVSSAQVSEPGQPTYCGPWYQAWYVSASQYWYSWSWRWCYNPSVQGGWYVDWNSWQWGGYAGPEFPLGPYPLSPSPAFDPLLPTLRQMTTAPIMLPASLPPRVGGVAIEQDPNAPNATGRDQYGILFLPTNPDQIVQPYVHAMTLGRLIAWPAITPPPDPTNGLGTPQRLEDVALPDGTIANLTRLEPPQGANYGPFTVGTFEEGGHRYTVLIENDSAEGDATREMLSTMVRVPNGS